MQGFVAYKITKNLTIELLKPFKENIDDTENLANPILVYADLLATGEPRNLETARILREKYINEHLWAVTKRAR